MRTTDLSGAIVGGRAVTLVLPTVARPVHHHERPPSQAGRERGACTGN